MSILSLLDLVRGPETISGVIGVHDYERGKGGTRYSGWARWAESGCRKSHWIEAKYLRHLGFPLRLSCADPIDAAGTAHD